MGLVVLLMQRLPEANIYCQVCSLSKDRLGGKAIFGQSDVSFSQVLMAVVSAYPGGDELKTGISLSPGPIRSQIERNMLRFGAGAFLRLCLHLLFDQDPEFPQEYKPFEKYVFFTNAVKCSPLTRERKQRSVAVEHVQQCRTWLYAELDQLRPQVPILLAASQAVSSLLPEGDTGIYNNRSIIHHWKQHPMVVTMNPVEAERGTLHLPVDTIERLGVQYPTRMQFAPMLVGSAPWFFYQDLNRIKQLVVEFLRDLTQETPAKLGASRRNLNESI